MHWRRLGRAHQDSNLPAETLGFEHFDKGHAPAGHERRFPHPSRPLSPQWGEVRFPTNGQVKGSLGCSMLLVHPRHPSPASRPLTGVVTDPGPGTGPRVGSRTGDHRTPQTLFLHAGPPAGRSSRPKQRVPMPHGSRFSPTKGRETGRRRAELQFLHMDHSHECRRKQNPA